MKKVYICHNKRVQKKMNQVLNIFKKWYRGNDSIKRKTLQICLHVYVYIIWYSKYLSKCVNRDKKVSSFKLCKKWYQELG